ncbi:MAG: PRC-barrel domain protein [Planctomycetaceae bacterium]|nr:PRC-barrel domain protein [Planctomycetaceae bacterium]
MVLSRKALSGVAFTLAAAMISASFIVAQDAPPANPAAKPGPDAQHFRAKQILGSKVNIQGNMSVGTVDDIVLDEHGNVDYLIVANADQKLVTVPWDAAAFNVDERIATVQITPDRFQQIPTYTARQYPVFSTPGYRVQVYKNYGLTPGQERRAIRRSTVVVPN